MATQGQITVVEDRNFQSNGIASQFPEVLVISGDISLSQFLTEGLTESGFWMSAVRSGLQALEVFRLRGFDSIVIDAAISDLPLDELIRRLRATPFSEGEPLRQSAETPIVVIAGNQEELEAYDLNAFGIARLFVAPFDLDDVATILRGFRRPR